MSEGNFDDDMFDKSTFIVQVDGSPVVKIGNGAKYEPDMETSKKTDVHRICTLAATAMIFGQTGERHGDVVIGIPMQLIDIPEERISYKDYILGKEGEKHHVRIKTDCEGPVYDIEFSFDKRYVYPEGIGPVYQEAEKCSGAAGIIDIGNLNTNNLYLDRFQIIDEASFSSELGGKVVISGLAQALSAELGARVDDNLAANVLLRPYEERFLTAKNGDERIKERSRRVIDTYLIEHVRSIKSRCDTKHWPIEFMDILCVGGTSKLLARELKIVFGANLWIPQDPEYTNVRGFLRRLTASAGIDINEGKEA